MVILLVLKDHEELNLLKKMVSVVYPDAEIAAFDNGADALNYTDTHIVDLCFTEVVMRPMSGIALVTELRKTRRDISVNFIADTTEYALDAWKLYINDYLLKPVSVSSVEHAKKKQQYAS